mmetsp:Transcript_18481/g.51574  ORF Transcript_18481/g.51574 Transcript_18481/m.51574 type:complete len:291 (+) Transcript_18481:3790-4662(+)
MGDTFVAARGPCNSSRRSKLLGYRSKGQHKGLAGLDRSGRPQLVGPGRDQDFPDVFPLPLPFLADRFFHVSLVVCEVQFRVHQVDGWIARCRSGDPMVHGYHAIVPFPGDYRPERGSNEFFVDILLVDGIYVDLFVVIVVGMLAGRLRLVLGIGSERVWFRAEFVAQNLGQNRQLVWCPASVIFVLWWHFVNGFEKGTDELFERRLRNVFELIVVGKKIGRGVQEFGHHVARMELLVERMPSLVHKGVGRNTYQYASLGNSLMGHQSGDIGRFEFGGIRIRIRITGNRER